MNYSGSKFKLLDQILPLFDYSKDYFLDLFCGGGSVYVNVLDKYKKLLINDIIVDLIEIHKNLCNNPQIFIETVRNLAKTKENQKLYIDLKTSYNQEKDSYKRSTMLFALMLTCTNNFMRFNLKGEFNQSWGRREWSDSTQKKVDEFVEHVSKYKGKIFYSSKHFNNVKITKPSMIYLDPPYGSIQDENGNITNKKISEAGYNAYFNKEDDLKLYNYIIELNNQKHSFMLSGLLEHDGKQSWIMNKLIKDGFKYKELIFDYNGVSRKGKKESKEIIIMNY
jgi:DNA adenine methylase Dam